jgi:hypothetical protein
MSEPQMTHLYLNSTFDKINNENGRFKDEIKVSERSAFTGLRPIMYSSAENDKTNSSVENDEKNGFVEVVYIRPQVSNGDGEYKIVFETHKTIVKKYDDKCFGFKEVIIGIVPCERICSNPDNQNIFYKMRLLDNFDVCLRKPRYLDEGDVTDEHNLFCDCVIVTSIKEL